MNIPITQKILIDWAGSQVFKDAELLVHNGSVVEASYDPPYIKGTITWSNRTLKTSVKILPDGTVESQCPCYANVERGMICPHVIAIGLVLVRRATDTKREEKYQQELRRASRLAAVNEKEYICRVSIDTPGAIPAKLNIILDKNWLEDSRAGNIRLKCMVECRQDSLPIDEVPKDIPLSFNKQDESILFVLEDICGGPAQGCIELSVSDFINIVRLHSGHTIICSDDSRITVNKTKITTFLNMDIDRENGELILMAHTELPFMKSGQRPVYIISGRSGWVYGANNLWPLENVLSEPYHSIYKEPVIVARQDIVRFLKTELATLSKYARIESDISIDLFTIEPTSPRFRLLVRGSPASLSATLYANYGVAELVAAKPDPMEHFAIPDPDDIMRYTVRNPDAEKAGLIRLRPSGFSGEYGDNMSSIIGNREVLNFLGCYLPSLRRKGWKVELEGKVSPYMDSITFTTPVVHIDDSRNSSWFDVKFNFEDSTGQSIQQSDVQTAILKGESFLKRGNTVALLDSDAIKAMQDVFSDCASGEGNTPGSFQMPNIYASFVKSSLNALDGIDIEDTTSWRCLADKNNRDLQIEPVTLNPHLNSILRGYQKDGVNWLAFQEKQGFCGILADEMGLGKTVQTLAWLQLERYNQHMRDKPALIICPTSLVENWEDEVRQFVPDMKTLILTGSDRHNKWDQLEHSNIVITSYAILRRDLEQYLEHEFSAVILDEAQHIKNRSSQNAAAAKQIRAGHKLVLTGTPVENSVSDLWSIMDFLMPGYLASHDLFRKNYELPITHGNNEGETAQIKLKRKLHPFLLRRLKTEVAKDLPDKIEKISSCQLTTDQITVYNELLKSSRQKISNMISKEGFNKCRMEILATLTRLRQACCHLDLLKLPDFKPQYPSGKMDLFFELVDEALDGGHRILVFSQFVTMLSILQKELTERNLAYCYLDGSTKDRMTIVRRFNTDHNIPLFLISLKAGGSGLNLTGADMVIHFDPWWNPAVENQATDRAHRIGQKRTVYSIKLITKGTVEEKVLALQKKKKAIIDSIIESNDKIPQNMTQEDIREILNI